VTEQLHEVHCDNFSPMFSEILGLGIASRS